MSAACKRDNLAEYEIAIQKYSYALRRNTGQRKAEQKHLKEKLESRKDTTKDK